MKQIILQFESEGDDSLVVDDLSHRYFWQPGAVDHLMADEQAQLDNGNIATDGVLWALTDQQGTVHDLAEFDAATGATIVVDHIIRDSFGKVVSESDPSQGSLIGWTGRPMDRATGLQNNWKRWYDAAIARWLSTDPISFTAGDANIYRYVANNPINFTDPSGLAPSGYHHPYPLYLGGAFAQDVIQLTKEQHTKAHRYLRQLGWGYSKNALIQWKKLSQQQQRNVIIGSLKAAEVPERIIRGVIRKAMSSAIRHAKKTTPRTGSRAGQKIYDGKSGKLIKQIKRLRKLSKVKYVGILAVGAAIVTSDDVEGAVVDTFHPFELLFGGSSTLGYENVF